MTKKDAIKILQCRGNGYSEKDFNDALEMAYDALSKPSFPSDLEEAAFAYEVSAEYPPANIEEERMICNAFKAGAKWMAGRGATFDGIVRDDGFVDFDEYGSIMMIPSNYSYFNNGDKVTVQIRKK